MLIDHNLHYEDHIAFIIIMIQLKFKEIFDMKKTFTCGQIFRFKTFDGGKSYYGPLSDRYIHVKQKSLHIIQIESNKIKNLGSKLDIFFRMKDNYTKMLKSIAIDSIMAKIIFNSKGLHLLKQDQFECIFAYIISQQSNIPRINHHLNQIAELYGEEIRFHNRKFYLFPDRENLKQISEQKLKELGFGYRARYISTLLENYPDFLIKPPKNSIEFNKNLQSIFGIGQKVADCIQLFGYGDLNWFPVDVWMQKFMLKYYSEGKNLSSTKLAQIGREMFGNWAGYAQEFIYYYSRNFEEF